MRCPDCGYILAERETECPRCAALARGPVSAEAPPAPAPPIAPSTAAGPEAFVPCSACGAPMPRDARECPRCLFVPTTRVWRQPHPLARIAYYMAGLNFLVPCIPATVGIVLGILAIRRGDSRNGMLAAVLCLVSGLVSCGIDALVVRAML